MNQLVGNLVHMRSADKLFLPSAYVELFSKKTQKFFANKICLLILDLNVIKS